jgi:quercetin dioxygenase-like cupin family protein
MNAELRAFARRYMRGEVPQRVPVDAVRMLVNSTEVVLHRDGQFQVELITLRKGCTVPPHVHPNIDTYEIALSGSGTATVGAHTHGGKSIVAIKAGVLHSAAIGSTDTAFLSIQQWHGVAPTFITDDWEGEAWQ